MDQFLLFFSLRISVTIKLQRLLDFLYFGHIVDTFSHFIGIIVRGSACKS